MKSTQIPIHCPQNLPETWKESIGEAEIDSEELLTRRQWMDDEFYDDYRARVDTKALSAAVMHAFTSDSVPKISFQGENVIYQIFCLEFPDRFRVEARIPKQSARRMSIEATVAIMTMARCLRQCPAPKIYAWHPDTNNPVGAPYILLQWLETPAPWLSLYSLPSEDLTEILHQLASQHANLAYPLHFGGYGSVYFSKTLRQDDSQVDLTNPATYELGPLSLSPSCTAHTVVSSWPTQTTASTLRDLWRGLWRDEVEFVKSKHGSERSTIIITADDPSPLIQEAYTLGQFLDSAEHLETLIDKCSLPADGQLYSPCFVTTDYAFRNIKFDPKTYKVAAFLDWEDVYVLPFLLCSRFPEDICWTEGSGDEWTESGAFKFLPVGEEADDSSSDDEDLFPSDSDSDDSSADYGTPISALNPEHYDRPRRIKDTELRRQYALTLANYDSRFATEGFWDIRQDPLKIQHLVTFGWTEWLNKSTWLKNRAGQLS